MENTPNVRTEGKLSIPDVRIYNADNPHQYRKLPRNEEHETAKKDADDRRMSFYKVYEGLAFRLGGAFFVPSENLDKVSENIETFQQECKDFNEFAEGSGSPWRIRHTFLWGEIAPELVGPALVRVVADLLEGLYEGFREGDEKAVRKDLKAGQLAREVVPGELVGLFDDVLRRAKNDSKRLREQPDAETKRKAGQKLDLEYIANLQDRVFRRSATSVTFSNREVSRHAS